jgi:hypothetical protein
MRRIIMSVIQVHINKKNLLTILGASSNVCFSAESSLTCTFGNIQYTLEPQEYIAIQYQKSATEIKVIRIKCTTPGYLVNGIHCVSANLAKDEVAKLIDSWL